MLHVCIEEDLMLDPISRLRRIPERGPWVPRANLYRTRGGIRGSKEFVFAEHLQDVLAAVLPEKARETRNRRAGETRRPEAAAFSRLPEAGGPGSDGGGGVEES